MMMSSCMEALPEEILRSLVEYCSREDRLNLACCSQKCSHMLIPVMWQSVNIDLRRLTEKESRVLQHLQYTTKLSLDTGFLPKSWKRQDVGKHYLDCGLLLARLMTFFNPDKVRTLSLSGVSESTAHYILSLLPSVRILSISHNSESEKKWNWERMPGILPPVNEFRVQGIPSKHIGRVLEKLELTSLGLTIIEDPDITLNLIGEKLGLKELTLSIVEPFVCDLKPIGNLKCLTELNLHGGFTEESFINLCHNLQQLKVLYIGVNGYPCITCDSFFREIHRLTSLTHLYLASIDISTKCFEYIGSMKSLRSLSVEINGDGPDIDRENASSVAFLDNIATLEIVKVWEDESSKAMNAFVYGLVQERDWILEFDNGDITFTFRREKIHKLT